MTLLRHQLARQHTQVPRQHCHFKLFANLPLLMLLDLDDDCLANMDSIGLDELDFCATMQRCSSLEEERAILRQQIAKYEKSMQAMNETMKKLRENVKSVSKRNANLRKKANRNPANQPTDPKLPLKDHIKRHLDIAMSTHVQGRRTAPFGAALADVVFEYREGISYNAIMSKVRDIIRATILNPWKIAAKMDEHGGTMNLKCLEILRSIETGGRKHVRKTLIPSTHEMQCVFKKLEKMGDVEIPYTISQLEGGEAVTLDYEKSVTLGLTSFGLAEKAKVEKLAVTGSIDGANITKYLTQVVAGYKIKDRSSIHPLTGLPVFAGANSTVQSRTMCFPTNRFR